MRFLPPGNSDTDRTSVNRISGPTIELAGNSTRIVRQRWLRNIAVALGNGHATASRKNAQKMKSPPPSALLREHLEWALTRLPP